MSSSTHTETFTTLVEAVKPYMNWAAAGSVVATIAGWLPALAALLGAIWYCILIYDRIRRGPRATENAGS